MSGILVKGTKSYNYDKAVKGSSFIRLYDASGFCFKSFLDISTAGFADYASYVLTTDQTAVTGKTYFTRSGNVGSYSFVAAGEGVLAEYELVQITDYEVAKVAGVGAVSAESGELVNKKLTLTLPVGTYAQSELQVNFKTPVASCDLGYIVIDGIEFELVDTDNTRVDAYKCAFVANGIVSVILDLETKKANVQNLKYNSKIKVSSSEPSVDEDIELWINPDGAGVIIDDVVTEGSDNLITSDAVYNYVKNYVPDFNSISVEIPVTLLADNWTSTDGNAPYYNTVSDIQNLPENGIVAVAGDISDEEKDVIEEALIDIYEESEGSITFVAEGEKPEIDINLVIMGTDIIDGSIPIFNGTNSGLVPNTSGNNGNKYLAGDGKFKTITIPDISVFDGTNKGLVPDSDGDSDKYLSADGSFKTIPELLASNVSYDNSNTDLEATNVQNAIDEVYKKTYIDHEVRINNLETFIYSDITTNAHSMTFENLEGLQVTGVWNEALQRLEC